METIYLAIDGDDVGNQLEYYILRNDEESIVKFSAKYTDALAWLKSEITQLLSAAIILAGGDTLLVSLSSHMSQEHIEAIRQQFEEKANSTLSMGLGSTIRDAHIALKYAKVSGKNRLCMYEEISDG